MPGGDLRARIAALQPQALTPDPAPAANALKAWNQAGSAIVYAGDGLAQGGDFARFATALGDAGSVTELRWQAAPARLLRPPQSEADRLVAQIEQVPQRLAGHAAGLAQSGDGR